MNINEVINQLTQWFDFGTSMVIHHPLLSVTGALIAYLFYQAITVLQLTGAVISAALGVVMGILLNMLTS